MDIYGRNGILYVNYTENGRRVRSSLKLQDTKANRAYAMREILPNLEARLRQNIPTKAKIKLSDFLEKVVDRCEKQSTAIQYQNAINQILEYLDDKDITKYTTIELNLCFEKLRARGLNIATIKTYFTPLKVAFNEALQQGIIAKNPLILPRIRQKNRAEKSAYNIFQVKQILANATGDLKAFLYFLFYTGARSGEILALTYGDIKENSIMISKNRQQRGEVDLPKNGKKREIFILKPLRDFIDTMKFGEKDESIFKKTYATYFKAFKELLKTLGYKGQGLHSTRHTFISLCVSAKVDLMLIQKMVGHSNLDMIYKVYSHYLDSVEKKQELENAFSDTELPHKTTLNQGLRIV